MLFLQDEYRQVDKARYFINYLKIDSLYTLAGDESKSVLYPEDKVNLKHIITTLPGYVCNYKEYKNANRLTPQSSRKIDIGYRGRPLQYWLGEFGQRKSEIGKFFKNISHELQLNVDIETSEAKRIYGKKWYGFLESCKATLGVEGGSGLIDTDGIIQKSAINTFQIILLQVFKRYGKKYFININKGLFTLQFHQEFLKQQFLKLVKF